MPGALIFAISFKSAKSTQTLERGLWTARNVSWGRVRNAELPIRTKGAFMKAIVTVIGKDRVGIIAKVSNALAENRVNIMDISQTILQDYFAMIMLVDLTEMTIPFSDLSEKLVEQGKTIGVQIKIQREEIFKAMHQI
jgi:ACT domain-containing protein